MSRKHYWVYPQIQKVYQTEFKLFGNAHYINSFMALFQQLNVYSCWHSIWPAVGMDQFAFNVPRNNGKLDYFTLNKK